MAKLTSYLIFMLASWHAIHTNEILGQRNAVPSHPWIASAPGEFVRLIQAGEVQIEVDDQRLRKEQKVGLTVFTLLIDYRYNVQYQVIESSVEQQVIRANVRYKKPNIKITHKILVGSDFQPISPWTSGLLQHEMDHVAISTDPRLEKFIEAYFSIEHNWDFVWRQSSRPTDKQLQEKVVEKSQEMTIDVEKWLQHLYDYLDKESVQGTADIANRSKFFRSLYSEEVIQQSKLTAFATLSSEPLKSASKVPGRKLEAHFRIKID